MVELRNLFVRMLLGRGRNVSPKGLVDQWTGWDGQPMDPLVQQDACEFTQMLIDKLQEHLGQEFVGDLFAGTTVDLIEGMDVVYRSEKSQPFMTFTLPIVDCRNVGQAFAKFQLPDFFTGDNRYNADGIGKINARKFASLGTLPKHVIIQLGRFRYDYDTCGRIKINTEFEFPLELDLAPYSLSTETETSYELSGIIVHIGSADFGHYMSLVKIDGRWISFNDTQVSEVEQKPLLRMCYGKGAMSGYILFYTRKDVVGEVVNEPEVQEGLRTQYQDEMRLEDAY
jgi:ubiquitin C-terminal hydrolase